MRQPLKDLAAICAGQGAPQGDHNYCENGTPFVKAGNLQELLEGKAITSIQKVSDEVAKKHKLRLYPKGTILFAKSGMSCMKGYIYVLPQSAYVVSHLACITPNEDISEYLRYYFNYHKPNQLVKDAAYPSISLSDVGNLVVDMKPQSERNEIVSVLQHTESIITLRQQQLQKLNELVKARFIELFGDPVYNSKRLPIQRLCKLGSLDRGRSQHRPRNDSKLLNGPYPLIQTGEVASAGLYITKYKNTYSELGLRQSKMWSAGTLCITIAANIAQTAILTFDACFPDSVVGFLPNDSINAIYMHYWFGFFQKILEKQAPQVAQKNINLKILSELNVIVPTQEKQEQFAAFVEQTDKSKVAIQKALDEAQLLFDSLMQKYFG